MAELVVNKDTSIVNLLRFSFRRDAKHIFACDGSYLVKQAEREREEIEAQDWLLFTHMDEENHLYQMFVCLNTPICRALVKARISQKIRENAEKMEQIQSIYERRIKTLEKFKATI